MVKMFPVIAGAAMLAASVTVASAEELRLTDDQMDSVTGGFPGAIALADADASASALGFFFAGTLTNADTETTAVDGFFPFPNVASSKSSSFSFSAAD